MGRDTPRQRFGRLAQHVARRRAEQNKAARTPLRVDLRAQRDEKTGHELHFVEHDQALPPWRGLSNTTARYKPRRARMSASIRRMVIAAI